MTLLSFTRPVRPLIRLAATWRQRQALKRLDARALADIGLSYRQARHEARRPIWDAPRNWLM